MSALSNQLIGGNEMNILNNNIFEKYIVAKNIDEISKRSDRYKSWEYCYKYFCNNKDKIKENDENFLDLASLHLAFYLASWGMYRGSSFLLQTDYTVHKEAIKILKDAYVLTDNKISNWNIDILFGTKDGVVNRLKEYYKDIKNQFKDKINDITDTLLTKILMGTLGITPAYDRFFIKGVQLYNEVSEEDNISTLFKKENFKSLIKFAQKHEEELNNLDIRLIIDESIPYPLMKKIDMFFWNIGKPWVIQEGDKYYLTADKQNKKDVKEGKPYFNYLEEKKNLDSFEKAEYEKYYSKKG